MYSFIHDKANELERKFGSRNIYEIISQTDLHLMKFEDLGKLKGFYTKCLRQHYIGLNDKLPEQEKTMVAAHELGHHILHRDQIQFTLNDFQIFNLASQMEYEANIFAAELLFSDEQIEQLASEGRSYIEMSKILRHDRRMLLFKLNSMKQRGYKYDLPETPDSSFLGK